MVLVHQVWQCFGISPLDELLVTMSTAFSDVLIATAVRSRKQSGKEHKSTFGSDVDLFCISSMARTICPLCGYG